MLIACSRPGPEVVRLALERAGGVPSSATCAEYKKSAACRQAASVVLNPSVYERVEDTCDAPTCSKLGRSAEPSVPDVSGRRSAESLQSTHDRRPLHTVEFCDANKQLFGPRLGGRPPHAQQ